ncbi:MAG: HaeIII family restriction endonuclease [Bacteroidales bacterium]|nr:HaeIII family restriction endonuclease [Bacteroidales bacterium]
MAGTQVTNGKAFEYALATAYGSYLQEQGVFLNIVKDEAYNTAKKFYSSLTFIERKKFDYCAALTIESIVKLEPGLTYIGDATKKLNIYISQDNAGENGDARDIVFKREKSCWEIGFSAKNNNDAIKHSRLSGVLDFGKSWFDVPCSKTYWNEIKPIFEYTKKQKDKNRTWDDLGNNKQKFVYKPLLDAFRKELLYINSHNKEIPQKLIRYLIGQYSFYKIIKDDGSNVVIVKAFNINGELNKRYEGVKARYKIPVINLPTRIVEFVMKPNSDNTLHMILDGGWEISFRIHNAAIMVESSLKFDIQLLGNPPILFTQYLFQENEID